MAVLKRELCAMLCIDDYSYSHLSSHVPEAFVNASGDKYCLKKVIQKASAMKDLKLYAIRALMVLHSFSVVVHVQKRKQFFQIDFGVLRITEDVAIYLLKNEHLLGLHVIGKFKSSENFCIIPDTN